MGSARPGSPHTRSAFSQTSVKKLVKPRSNRDQKLVKPRSDGGRRRPKAKEGGRGLSAAAAAVPKPTCNREALLSARTLLGLQPCCAQCAPRPNLAIHRPTFPDRVRPSPDRSASEEQTHPEGSLASPFADWLRFFMTFYHEQTISDSCSGHILSKRLIIDLPATHSPTLDLHPAITDYQRADDRRRARIRLKLEPLWAAEVPKQ